MVQKASQDELLALVEISSNVLRRNFQLRAKEQRRLQKHWDLLRHLSRAKDGEKVVTVVQAGEGVKSNQVASRKRDRIKVVQRGGLLPALVLPILFQVVEELAESDDE
jgi:hypothetical protein